MDEEKTMLGKIRALLGVDVAETEAEVALEETSVQLETMKLADGSATMEAASFVVGEAVYILNEESGEKMPLPLGKYDLEGDVTLVVLEEGLIGELIPTVAEDVPEVEMESEPAWKADFDNFKNEIKAMLSKQTEEEVVKLSAEKDELQAKIDSIPDAKPIKHAPSVIKEADLASMRPVELYRYKKQLN